MDKQRGNAGNKKTTPHLHAGHRQRMFAKLNRGVLCDHELLETLLFFAIPRRNTNDIAHRLLFEFGSLAGVLNASADELAQVDGMGERSAEFLQCVGAILHDCKDSIQRNIPTYYNMENFIAYVKEEYALLDREMLDVYLLRDDTHIFLRRRYSGGSNEVSVALKWLQKLLVDCAPTGIVLVHNHPSGSSRPSDADRLAVEKCQALCFNADVLLCDFCVCSKEGVYSYYHSGELQRVAKAVIAHNERKKPLVDKEE